MAVFILKYSDSTEITSLLDLICSFNVSMQNSMLGHWDALSTCVFSISVLTSFHFHRPLFSKVHSLCRKVLQGLEVHP